MLTEEKIKTKLISDVELVQKMTDYHIKTGGKRLRALLTLGAAKLCGYTKGSRDVNLAACVELIHSATLMHDDVIDEGVVRRGKETLNKVWNNHSSVLVGDYLLSRCFEMMVEDGNIEVLKLLSSTSSKIAQGEVLQLQHKGEVDMLEETYLKIISAKTAELFAAATKVGAILSNSNKKEKDALEFYGRNLGLTFQIADDTLDYNAELKLFGKKIGQDFFEGKITLPIILLYQKLEIEEKNNLINMFSKDTRDKDDLDKTIASINKHKIINECYQKAQHYINLASNSLSVFEDTKEKEILKNLTTFSLSRSF
jgi:octaprenyl-diphosphate synthase